MKIRVTEKSIKLNVDNRLQVFQEGDEVTVEDKVGTMCVSQGWADDIDGNTETGPRVPGAVAVQPDNVKSEIS